VDILGSGPVDLDIINVDPGTAAHSAFLSEFDSSCPQARVEGAAIKVAENIILSGNSRHPSLFMHMNAFSNWPEAPGEF
jgi:hypothetical protein